MELIQLIAVLVTVTLGIVIINNLKLNKIMASNAEILAQLEEANTTTNEIAEDLQDLINNSGVSQEVADKLTAHIDRLKAVAATHTPGGVTPTP